MTGKSTRISLEKLLSPKTGITVEGILAVPLMISRVPEQRGGGVDMVRETVPSRGATVKVSSSTLGVISRKHLGVGQFH